MTNPWEVRSIGGQHLPEIAHSFAQCSRDFKNGMREGAEEEEEPAKEPAKKPVEEKSTE